MVKSSHAADVGDGIESTIVVRHDLGTRDVIVQVYRNSDPFSKVDIEVMLVSEDKLTLVFYTAPSPAQYRVVILAAHV